MSEISSINSEHEVERAVFSFDVFDTVLARAVSPSVTVFALAARRARTLLPSGCTPSHFVFLRRRAQQKVSKWQGGGVALIDIYREMQTGLNLSDEVTRELMNIEIEVEHEVLYPIPHVKAKIETLRTRGASIVFTSDMHLSSNCIRGLLREHEIWQPEDQVFVSCEHGTTKHRGGLFQPVLQEVENRETIVHIGNSRESDVRGAEAAGIDARHVTEGNLNRYEQILGGYAQETAGMSGKLAGASRYARLHTRVESTHEEALRDVAAGVMAPVLVGFVAWLLGRVQRRDLDRLYFTSRDGYHLVPIARRLGSLLGIDCEFEYLYLSRAVVSAARSASENAEGAEDACEEAKVARKRLCRYVTREGLDDAGESGFVDLGWRGSIHGYLNEILIDEGVLSRPMMGFLFGLDADQQAYPSYRTAYFFDKYRGEGYKDVLPDRGIYTVMETFCTADHGTVIGYDNEDGQVSPALEPSWSARVESWGFPVVERTVESFLDGLAGSDELLSCKTDVRAPLAEVLQTFWRTPTSEEAAAWGRFPRELDQGEGHIKPVAEPYTEWSALPRFARYGRHANEDLKHKFSWMEGSLARSGPGLRRSIRAVLRGREIAKYILFGVAEKVGIAGRLGQVIMKWGGRPSEHSNG